MPAEAVQEKGRRGVATTKRWLEATTFIELQWNVYENSRYCTLMLLNGKPKRWDLAGQFLTGAKQQVFVENKDYGSAGAQAAQFSEFLANCYSATARSIEEAGDLEAEFIWVTTHPFGSLSRWSKLATRDSVLEALNEHPGVLAERKADSDLADLVASRIWLLVFNAKQARLSLDRRELDLVIAALNRKADTL